MKSIVPFLLLTLLNSFGVLYAQSSFTKDLNAVFHNLDLQSSVNVKHEPPPKKFWQSDDVISPHKYLFLSTIYIYQTVISTQDMPVCNFTPSCSRFSVMAFEKAGLVKGILLTSDRLQRDIGFPGIHRHYIFDPVIEKFADPIENYTLPEKKE